MVDEPEDSDGKPEEAGKGGGGLKQKMPLIAGGAVAVLLLVGGGVAFMMGWIGGGEEEGLPPASAVSESDATPSVYFDMPEIVVNLASGRDRPQYLKLKVALEAESQAYIDALQPKLPRVQDMFLIYLREMRRSDLEGSAAVYRLKQELARRINIAIYPASIKRVLFKEMIVQ